MFCDIVMLDYVRYVHNYDYNTNMFVFHLLYLYIVVSGTMSSIPLLGVTSYIPLG